MLEVVSDKVPSMIKGIMESFFSPQAARRSSPELSGRSYVSTVYYGMKMRVKIPGFLIQWRLQYRRAKNHFRKELIAAGMSKKETNELADMYPFKLEELMRSARKSTNYNLFSIFITLHV